MNRYHEIETVSQWNEVLEKSNLKPIVVFKHSTRCPISTKAFNEFMNYCEEYGSDIECCLVKVIENRVVSDCIERDTGIRHESPQIHLLVKGISVWNTSHRMITKQSILESVERMKL